MKGHKPVGQYGNGFKSGSMRIGRDAVVFTKTDETMSIGMLSQTYLEAIEAETILVPIITWKRSTNILLPVGFYFGLCVKLLSLVCVGHFVINENRLMVRFCDIKVVDYVHMRQLRQL